MSGWSVVCIAPLIVSLCISLRFQRIYKLTCQTEFSFRGSVSTNWHVFSEHGWHAEVHERGGKAGQHSPGIRLQGSFEQSLQEGADPVLKVSGGERVRQGQMPVAVPELQTVHGFLADG